MGGRAVVLLSGGVDSATVLAIARDRGLACRCLSFDYGQRHAHELHAAGRVAAALGAEEHRVLPVALRAFGGSALTDDIPVPRGRTPEDMGADIPVTYVPARNLVFLSLAVAYAEVSAATSLWIGVNAVDYSGYPDCRPAFIRAFEDAANLATRAGVGGDRLAIEAPLASMTKAEIIRRGVALGVDYALTHSCYDPDASGRACGSCDSCEIRRRGFAQAGVADPTVYAPG